MLLRFVTRARSPLCSNALAVNRLAQVAPKSYFPRSVLRSRLETPCEVRQIITGIRPSFANTLHGPTKSPLLFKARNLKFTIACATTGLALALSVDTIHCDAAASTGSYPVSTKAQQLPPLPTNASGIPESSVNAIELSFGTICGICTGVFVKKGAKLVAFVLGGLFVLAQYLVSKQVIRVNWAVLASGYEKAAYEGGKAPSVTVLWRRFIDFLLADFGPRATFLAGFALGLRIG